MLLCIATFLHLLVIAHVDDSLLKLPSRNPAVEQDVKLAVRAVLELREEEVGHDPADKSGAAPDVAALASHVPAGGVEHLRREIDHRNLGHPQSLSAFVHVLWTEWENLHSMRRDRRQC